MKACTGVAAEDGNATTNGSKIDSIAQFSIDRNVALFLLFGRNQGSTYPPFHKRLGSMSCKTKKCYFIFLYDDLEEYEEEIAKLDRIIAAEPENFYAWHNRGVMHWEIGNGAAARRDLTKAASLPHTDYMPHNSLTVIFKEAGETDAAIAACTTGLTILPNDPVLNRELGLLYAEKKLYELALKHIDIAIHNNDSYKCLDSHRTAILKALNKPQRT